MIFSFLFFKTSFFVFVFFLVKVTFKKNNFIRWLYRVFAAVCAFLWLWLRGDTFSVWSSGFSLRWLLLLQSMDSGVCGLSSSDPYCLGPVAAIISSLQALHHPCVIPYTHTDSSCPERLNVLA